MKYIAVILFVLLLTSYDGSCVGGMGIQFKVDNVEHSFSWHGHK